MKTYSITQNTSFLTIASILQKVISFFYFTLIARMVGVNNTGQYFLAIAFTTIFAVIADFGLSPVLTREIAKQEENSDKFINTVIPSKLFFGAMAYLLVALSAYLLGYEQSTRNLIYLSGITMFLDNLHSGFFGIFRARKNLIYESIAVVAMQFTTLVIGTFALLSHAPLYWLILAYTIPSFLAVMYSGFFARKIYHLHYNLAWNKDIFKFFISLSWPFALAGIISRLYAYSDSLLMSKMLSAQALGWWSVPYKVTFAFQFIPIALSASIYPVFSNLYVVDKDKIGPLFTRAWRYLFIIIFPLSFGLFALANSFVLKVFGSNFLPSVTALRILMLSLIFSFLSFVTGALLNATDRQKVQTGLLAAALIVDVILNLFLLPRFGIVGAAVSALLGNMVLSLGGYILASRKIKISHLEILKYFNQTFWPALIMAGIVYLLSIWKFSLFITVPLGVIIYGILIFLTGGLTKQMFDEALIRLKIKKATTI